MAGSKKTRPVSKAASKGPAKSASRRAAPAQSRTAAKADKKTPPEARKRTAAEAGRKTTRDAEATRGAPARTPARTKPPKPGAASAAPAPSATESRQIERLEADIRRLEADRDALAALQEAAMMEREILKEQLAEAERTIESLERGPRPRGGARSPSSTEPLGEEDSPTEGGGSSVASERPSASASADEAGIDEDEADAEDETEEADEEDEADEGESIYDRFDDPRVRRKELDRERIDREEESQGEGFWMICPKCGDHLEEVESDGVKIDRCEGCGGIYLDRGELEMLLTFARGRRGHTRVRSILQV